MLRYPDVMPDRLRYQYCPMCRAELGESPDVEGKVRLTCPSCGWIHYPSNIQGVSVVITTAEGLVFLLPPGEPDDAPAALPGGVVEFGESPEEAAVREAREETGLEVELQRFLGYWFNRDMPYAPMLHLMYEARIVGGRLRDSPEGRVAVFPQGRFPPISPRRAGSRRTLEAYLQSRRQGDRAAADEPG